MATITFHIENSGSDKYIRYTDNINSDNSRSDVAIADGETKDFDAQQATSGLKQTNVKIEVAAAAAGPYAVLEDCRHPEDDETCYIDDSNLP